MRLRTSLSLLLSLLFSVLAALPSLAQSPIPGEELCDSGFQDCRQLLWNRMNAETVAIDVAFWFMFDGSLVDKLIEAKNRGVKVRVLIDDDASNEYDDNIPILARLAANGIPMRDYKATDGIQHWKMMLFAGQNVVQFSAANYGGNDFVATENYRNYIAEAIFFCKTPSVIDSFKTRFDDLWTNDTLYRDYANIVRPLARSYPTTGIDPEMNFVPIQNYLNRLLPLINGEHQKIDVIMYRFTVRQIADALIDAWTRRGVPVRLITEQDQYRKPNFRWDAFNIDRIHKAGIPVKQRKHLGLMHQKSIILYGQNQVVFGSTNWDEGAVQVHQEHNYFTTRAWINQWFIEQFNRRWDSVNPVGAIEYENFVPLPPDAPVNLAPANTASGQSTTSVTLTWEGGMWAHKYDIYLGTSPGSLPLIAGDVVTGSIDDGVNETHTVPVAAGTTYYWRIVGKTMADKTATGPTWSFTTSGAAAPAPTVTAISPNSGSSNGGTAVTITGTNFQSGATVTIGGTAATGVNVASTTSITATTPAHSPGTVDVVVRNPDNRSDDLPGGFTYTGVPSSGSEIVLYAAEAPVKVGWTVVSDATAAGGSRIFNADAGAGKIVTPSANPSAYFEISFSANAGTPYHLWMRGRAQSDSPFNDSVHIQFSDSVDSAGAARWRIGTTEGQEYNLENCFACGVQGWGWQDNAWGAEAVATLIRFQNSGTHTMRVQVREDGLSLDQIVLSPATYLNASPGALVNDNIILPKSGGPAPGPSVSAIAPASGTTAGGTSVTITGSNFVSGATVTIGGTAATSVNVVSSTSITATTPAHTAGTVDVVVRNPDTLFGTLPSGFTYTSGSGLPAPWTNADIGGPALAGSASFSAGAFTISGSGADIYGTSDMFHFVYRPMTGDGEIIARVDSMANTSDIYAVAGVMIRKSLAADSPHAAMLVMPSFSGRAKFRSRLQSGAITDSDGPGAGSITLPQWVRLVRTGTRVDAYHRSDSETSWTFRGFIDIDLGANAHVGLVVNSHNNSTLCTTTISNVSP